MMKPADAERATGYKVGGISPFGQTKPARTAIEEQALAHAHVFINAGQRGLHVRLSPRDAADMLKALVAPLVACLADKENAQFAVDMWECKPAWR